MSAPSFAQPGAGAGEERIRRGRHVVGLRAGVDTRPYVVARTGQGSGRVLENPRSTGELMLDKPYG